VHFGSILEHFIRFWPILEHFWDIVFGTFLIFSKPYFHTKSRFCDFFGVAKKFPTMATPVPVQNQRGGHGGHGGHKKKGKMIIQIIFLKKKTWPPWPPGRFPLILYRNWGGHGSKLFGHPKKIAESAF
jgi:hypothetical protein